MSDSLKLKTINQLLGENFFIPHYQRGYRWTDQQVTDLLNDIWTFARMPRSRDKDNEFYCLQPIVIKQKVWERDNQTINGWEVIDGQQRLTTIHIILNYLKKEHIKEESLVGSYGKDLFTIKYETRPGSELFLNDITDDKSNIDFYHMAKAYDSVEQWFSNGQIVKDRSDREQFLSTILGKQDDKQSVQIIWFDADPDIRSQELFTRLNIGKMPLTNAELIKALFLSSSSFQNELSKDKDVLKIEIALFWDEIEQRLANDDYWSFITNRRQAEFANKIELLFDMIAGKKHRNTDPLYTFLHFYNKVKDQPESLRETWQQIRLYDQTLHEWYNNRNLYHKVGYLITIGNNLSDLLAESFRKCKDEFEAHLDNLIRLSVNCDLEKLSYNKNNSTHNKRIENVLMLFNIESIRRSQNISERYPFKYHKAEIWSLEHIHAQNSESLDRTKKELWIKWLDYHADLMKDMAKHIGDLMLAKQFTDLLSEIQQLKENDDRLTWDKFDNIAERIIDCFSDNSDDSMDEIHGLGNLALLGLADNSALNNSVFEVKRRELIKIDNQGSYIPICTRRVFLRYYSPTIAIEHPYMWSADDRKSYFQEIVNTLSNYLPENQPEEVS